MAGWQPHLEPPGPCLPLRTKIEPGRACPQLGFTWSPTSKRYCSPRNHLTYKASPIFRHPGMLFVWLFRERKRIRKLRLAHPCEARAFLGRLCFRFAKDKVFGRFLARPEARIAVCGYTDCRAGPGITTLTLFFVFHYEASKAS